MDMSGDVVTIPLRKPPAAALCFGVISVVAVAGSVAAMVLIRSWQALTLGTLVIVAIVWVWGTVVAVRRARASTRAEIVVSSQGVQTHMWAIDWDRVRRMWIGRSSAGRLQALMIEPLEPSDVKSSSRVLKFNFGAGRVMGAPPIQILQVNVDRPLEEIASLFEAKAGRPLLSPPLGK